MMQPKRTKYRKSFRGRRRGLALRGSTLSFGEFGLKAYETAWVSAAQIEAARRAVTHYLKRKGKVWIRVFPDKPVSARSAGQRMGGGKGDVDRYVAVITPGRIIFEVTGPEELLVMVRELKLKMQKAGIEMMVGKESNLKQKKMLRRDIRQILTIISEVKNENVKSEKNIKEKITKKEDK